MDNLRFGSQLHPAVGSHLLSPCPTKFTAAPARCGDLISRWPLPREFREGNTESVQAMERQWILYVSECVDLCSACMGCGREVVKGQLSSGLEHTSLSLAQSRTKEGPPLQIPTLKSLLPFPSAHSSAPVHKGLAPCARSSALPSLPFHPRRAVPAAPCWPP